MTGLGIGVWRSPATHLLHELLDGFGRTLHVAQNAAAGGTRGMRAIQGGITPWKKHNTPAADNFDPKELEDLVIRTMGLFSCNGNFFWGSYIMYYHVTLHLYLPEMEQSHGDSIKVKGNESKVLLAQKNTTKIYKNQNLHDVGMSGCFLAKIFDVLNNFPGHHSPPSP